MFLSSARQVNNQIFRRRNEHKGCNYAGSCLAADKNKSVGFQTMKDAGHSFISLSGTNIKHKLKKTQILIVSSQICRGKQIIKQIVY